uniref:Heparan-alpha-glucosaminide N-acetyltransferase catalytic domain-containing protein n=2 Tax=root TaxID=1 RepID=E6PRV7_9ZZZZ
MPEPFAMAAMNQATSPSFGPRRVRLGGLDTLRGLAIVWMMSFHFSFDLNWFGFIHADFYTSPWWLWQRICIVSLFLFSAGLAQSYGDARGRREAAFWKRWGQIFGCGLLVVVGSYLAFPQSFIYFGILQGVAAMLLVHHLLSRRLGAWVLLLAPLAIAAPQLWGHPLFNPPLWNWTGLITQKPITEDYVPLLPWIGVFWVGSGLGVLLQRVDFKPLAVLPSVRPLAFLGRWPLTIYMLHQPVFVGLVWLAFHLKSISI